MPALAWAVAAALLLARTGLLLWSVRHPFPITGDEPVYEELAANIAAGRGYFAHGVPWAFKPPGWPMLLAAAHAVLGPGRMSIVFLQALFDCGTILLCGWTALRVMGSRAAATIAFLLALVWPPFFREARFMQTEPLFTFLVMASVAAFGRFTLAPSAWRAFAVGLVAGVASLVRPNGLAPLGGLILGWLVHRLSGLRVEIPRLAALLLGIVLVLTPWTLRNARVFHVFLPVSTGGGEQFYAGSILETDGRWNYALWGTLKGRVAEAESLRIGHAPNPVELDRALLRAGIANWKADPRGSAWISVKRLWRLCFLPVVSGDRPLLRAGFFVALLALYAAAIPAGLAGLRAPGGTPALAGAMLVAVVLNALALSVFYTNSRYFEPTRPLLIVLAAGTLARVWERRPRGA